METYFFGKINIYNVKFIMLNYHEHSSLIHLFYNLCLCYYVIFKLHYFYVICSLTHKLLYYFYTKKC